MELALHSLDKRGATRALRRQKVCLSEILNELMDERKVEAADIHKATGIGHSTISNWVRNKVQCPMLDGNMLALSRYFNVSLTYLVFGIGDSDPVYLD